MNTPAAMPPPIQPKPPFPAWRLRNGTKNATEVELELASEACQDWSKFCGFLVVAGLVLEVLMAIRHAPFGSLEGRIGPVIADAMIAIGVLGEVLLAAAGHRYDSELTRRSKESLLQMWFWRGFAETSMEETSNNLADAQRKLANAIQRAAQLEHETEKLRAQLAPRSLTKEQYETLQTLKGKVEEICFIAVGQMEAHSFAASIMFPLHSVGIKTTMLDTPTGVLWAGILVIEPDHPLRKTGGTGMFGPVTDAFRDAGLYGGGGSTPFARMDIPEGVPLVMVGEKTFPFAKQPYFGPPQGSS